MSTVKFQLLILFGFTLFGHNVSLAQPQSTHPVWSPDGNQLAFINNSIGTKNDNAINFEVYTFSLDNKKLTRHTFNTSFEADIIWSPDGTQIAVKSYRDENDEVYVIDLKSGDQLNISNHPKRDSNPFWSKDGKLIYFQSNRDHPKGELYSYNLSTRKLTRITNNDFSESGAVWSPDGSTIAFVSDMDGDDDIYLMNISSKEVAQLTDNELNDWYPQWSPDGKSLLFTYGNWETDEFEIRIINKDGSDEETIIDKSDSGNASWHPDGKKIAFGKPSPEGGEVFIYDLEKKTYSLLVSYKNF